MGKRRVVVTGLGIVSPVGNSVASAWRNICAGRSGIGEITEFDVTEFPVRFAGVIRDFDVGDYLSPREARRMDAFIHYAIAAADQAMADAGIEGGGPAAARCGVAVGSGIGGIAGIEAGHRAYLDGGPRKISPFFVPGNIINMAPGQISMRHGLKGPNLAIVTACSAGTHSIGQAARAIACDEADVMVAGGAEKSISPLGLGGFSAARALSTRNDDPAGASRPFARGRDGFVLAEGAGIVVLESLEHAEARGATPYAEVIGFGMSGDAYHITQPPEDGEGGRRCMEAALADAGLAPEAVGYVNTHGTSTPVGDLAEARALRAVFGAPCRVPASSTKSMTGHLLGAAGGVEAIFTVLALRDGRLPPTINQDDPDPDCALDTIPGGAREAAVDVALSNSFGFGGTNATLVFRRCA